MLEQFQRDWNSLADNINPATWYDIMTNYNDLERADYYGQRE